MESRVEAKSPTRENGVSYHLYTEPQQLSDLGTESDVHAHNACIVPPTRAMLLAEHQSGCFGLPRLRTIAEPGSHGAGSGWGFSFSLFNFAWQF